MLDISFRCIIDAGDLNRIQCGVVIRLFKLRRLYNLFLGFIARKVSWHWLTFYILYRNKLTLRAKVRNHWNSAILGIFGVSENLENCPNLPQKCLNSDQNVISTFSVSNYLKSLKFRHSWHVDGEKCWLSSCSQLMYKILCYQAIHNCIKSNGIKRSVDE